MSNSRKENPVEPNSTGEENPVEPISTGEETHVEPISTGEETHDEPIAMGKIFNLQKLYLNGEATDVVQPGQTYEVTFALVNKSENALKNLQVSLGVMGANSSSVQIKPDRLSLPPIDPGEEVITGHFTVKVLSDIYSTTTEDQDLKSVYGFINFSLKIFQDSPNPDRSENGNLSLRTLRGSANSGTGGIETFAVAARFSYLQIVSSSSSFAISDQVTRLVLVAFITIRNENPNTAIANLKAQLIINDIGSTKADLVIGTIQRNEQKQNLYGIRLDRILLNPPVLTATNNPLNQDALTGCLKITSPLVDVELKVSIRVPLISICVVQSNESSLGFEEGVAVDLILDNQPAPSATRPTDENGGISFSQNEIGLSNKVKLSIPQRPDVSSVLTVSDAPKHHCTFATIIPGALVGISKIIELADIDNKGIKLCA